MRPVSAPIRTWEDVNSYLSTVSYNTAWCSLVAPTSSHPSVLQPCHHTPAPPSSSAEPPFCQTLPQGSECGFLGLSAGSSPSGHTVLGRGRSSEFAHARPSQKLECKPTNRCPSVVGARGWLLDFTLGAYSRQPSPRVQCYKFLHAWFVSPCSRCAVHGHCNSFLAKYYGYFTNGRNAMQAEGVGRNGGLIEKHPVNLGIQVVPKKRRVV